MERLIQSAKQAFSKTGIYLGLFAAITTIIGIVGFDKISINYLHRTMVVASVFATSYFVAFIKCYFYNKVHIPLGNNRSVTIEYGDLFSKQGVIIIPFNRFFDTVVNDGIINSTSVAGQFVKAKFAGNLDELDAQIAKTTNGIAHCYEVKKQGKKLAYPIGTVAKVQKDENQYYCIAQTDVDEEEKSKSDIEKLHTSIMSVLKFANKEANGREIYLPVLGSGFSRLNKDKQIILEYLISTLKTMDIPIQSNLHIMIWIKDRKLYDLSKHFL